MVGSHQKTWPRCLLLVGHCPLPKSLILHSLCCQSWSPTASGGKRRRRSQARFRFLTSTSQTAAGRRCSIPANFAQSTVHTETFVYTIFCHVCTSSL